MPEYILTPTLTKSVAEFDTWSNSAGEEVITVRYWRCGEISVTRDENPEIEVDPDNGVNLMEYFEKEYFDGKLNYSLDDCYCSQVYSYPDGMRRKRKERLDDLWEENDDLEEDGWDITGTEVWVYCEMTVKESQ
jgi:hypothetical protein